MTFVLKLDNSNLNNTDIANGEEEASTPKEEVEWLVITNIKSYYKAIVIKIVELAWGQTIRSAVDS